MKIKPFILIAVAAIAIYTLIPAQVISPRTPPNPRKDTWLYIFTKDNITGGWILLNPNPLHPEITKPKYR